MYSILIKSHRLTILLALLYATIILVKTRRVNLSPGYDAAMIQGADKPNPTYRTNPVPMTDSVPNTVIEPDITYNSQPNNQYHNRQSGYESFRQTSGIATPAPQYKSYYGTDAVDSPAPVFYELDHVENEIRV